MIAAGCSGPRARTFKFRPRQPPRPAEPGPAAIQQLGNQADLRRQQQHAAPPLQLAGRLRQGGEFIGGQAAITLLLAGGGPFSQRDTALNPSH